MTKNQLFAANVNVPARDKTWIDGLLWSPHLRDLHNEGQSLLRRIGEDDDSFRLRAIAYQQCSSLLETISESVLENSNNEGFKQILKAYDDAGRTRGKTPLHQAASLQGVTVFASTEAKDNKSIMESYARQMREEV